MALAILSMVLAAGPSVWVDLAPQTPCIERTRLTSRLLANGVEVADVAGNRVRLSASGDVLVVDGNARGRLLNRTVSTRGNDCDALERVVVTLIVAWVKTTLPGEDEKGPPKFATGALAQSADAGEGATQAPAVEGTGATGSRAAVASQPRDAREAPQLGKNAADAMAGRARAGSSQAQARDVAQSVKSGADDSRQARDARVGSQQEHTREVAQSVKSGSDAGSSQAQAHDVAQSPKSDTDTSKQARAGGAIAGSPRAQAYDATPSVKSGADASGQARAGDALAGLPQAQASDAAQSVKSGADPSEQARAGEARAGSPQAQAHDVAQSVKSGTSASALARAVEAIAGTSQALTPDEGQLVKSAANDSKQAAADEARDRTQNTATIPGEFKIFTLVSGGVAVGPTPDVVPAGALFVGASWQRWGVLLDLGLEGVRASVVDADGALVTAALQWASLSFEASFQATPALSLHVALGVRATRIEASASGVNAPTPAVLLVPGGVTSLSGRVRLIGPLHVELRATFGARTMSERLTVLNATSALTLSPFEFQGFLGFGGVFDLVRK